MGLLTGLVPNTGSSSCNTLNVQGIDSKILRRPSLAKSGTAINIEITEPEFFETRGRRKSSVALCMTSINEQYLQSELRESEQKVNFLLPANRRLSILHQQLQPTLRERIKGSPRFPHRINPTSSLSALEDSEEMNETKTDATGKFGVILRFKILWFIKYHY